MPVTSPPSPPGATPIEQTLESLAALEAATVQNACVANQPFIELGDGNAPTLDYNIPQTSVFTTYGTFASAYIPVAYFKDFTAKAPVNNFFNSVANMSADQVENVLHPAPTTVATGQIYAGQVAATTVSPYNVALQNGVVAQGHITNIATNIQNGGIAAGILNPGLQPNVQVGQAIPVLIQPGIKMAQPSLAANLVKNNPPLRPNYLYAIGRTAPKVTYTEQPTVITPRILIVEEYTTASYLGAYGAGKVVNSFSLFPGEKTSISVSSYQDSSNSSIISNSRNSATSDNVIDSMSDSSASEFDSALQSEQGSSASESNAATDQEGQYSTRTDSTNSSNAWNVGGNISFDNIGIGGGYGQSNSQTQSNSYGASTAHMYSMTGSRSANSDSIQNALNKTVQSANSARQNAISVNTTTASSATSTYASDSGSTSSTVRDLYNPNVSCVLNIIARNLLQQYTTITYLSNLKFAYTNGYVESHAVVGLPNLMNMLQDLILPAHIDEVVCTLLSPYCKVMNYQDDFLTFVELITITAGDCFDSTTPMSPPCKPDADHFWRKSKTCSDNYTDGVINVTVNGVILNVTQQTLLTPSIIWDALLGQGNALDCFNQKAQDATAMAAYIDNLNSMQRVEDNIQTTTNDNTITQQQISVVDALGTLTDLSQQAVLYKKVFGDCCDVPQSCGGCGCDDGK